MSGRRSWAVFVEREGQWLRSIPMSEPEARDDAEGWLMFGHTVRRCRPWLRFEATAVGAAFGGAT